MPILKLARFLLQIIKVSKISRNFYIYYKCLIKKCEIVKWIQELKVKTTHKWVAETILGQQLRFKLILT